MNNKNLIKLFIFLVVIACVCSVIAYSSEVQEITIVGDKVESTYAFNSTFIVPKKQFVKDDTAINTSTILEYPSGEKTSFKSAKLDELGVYTLKYFADIDGQQKSHSYTFETKLSSSSLWGGNHMIIPTDEKISTYIGNDEFEQKSAVLLSAHAKGYIEYENEIYIGDNTLDDELISFVVVPQNVDVIDFQVLKIVLEDADDENNKLYIKIAACGYDMANSGDFELSRYRYNTVVMVSVDDVNYTKATAMGDNFLKDSGFYGQVFVNPSIVNDFRYKPVAPISLRYSDQEDKLKVVSGSDEFEMNLFSQSFMGENTFDGFSTGRVKLSVGFEKFKTSKAGMVAIFDVDGVQMGKEIENSQKLPSVVLDYKYFNKGDVKAVVNAKHYFLPAKTIDTVSEKLDYKVSVYRVKDGVAQKINSANDYFVPSETGVYLIEYQTEQNFVGKKGKAQYLLNVVELSECEIDFEFGELPLDINVGDTIYIPKEIVTGGIGEKTVQYSAKVGQKIVDITNNTFFAEFAGELVLTATVTDDAYSEQNPFVITKSITVYGSEKTHIKTANIPAKIVAGDKIDLGVEVYKFTDNGKQDVEYTVKFDNVILNSDTIVPSVSQIGVKELVITSGSEQKVIPIEVVEPYGGTKKSSLEFFSLKNATGEVSDEYENIIVNFTQDSSIEFLRKIKPEFIRFGFAIKGNSTASQKISVNFESVNIVLIDAFSGKSVTVSISKGTVESPNYSKLTYQGETKDIYGSFYDAFAQESTSFEINYDKKNNALYDVKGRKLVELTKADDGTDISGLNEVYLRLEFTGVTGDSTVHFKSIANQSFDLTVKKGKNKGPELLFEDSEWSAKVNQEFVFPRVDAWDTLCEVDSVSVKITNASGNELYSGNGLGLLKYTFNQIGVYTVTYNALDIENNLTTIVKTISVIDEQDDTAMKVMGVKVYSAETSAPQVKIAKVVSQTAKVNESFNIAKIEVDDNGGKDKLKMYAYVIEPDGGRIILLSTPIKTTANEELSNEEKFAMFTDLNAPNITYSPSQKGKHLVYYLIIDQTGLSTIVYYAVDVAEVE